MSRSLHVAVIEDALNDADHDERLAVLRTQIGAAEVGACIDLVIEHHVASAKSLGKPGVERLTRAKTWRAKNP